LKVVIAIKSSNP